MDWPDPIREYATRSVLPAACKDKQGHPFTIRAFRPEDRGPLESFYDAFEPKRAAQGLPPKGAERIARWLDTVLPGGVHLMVEMVGELIGHALLVPTSKEGVAEYAIFLRKDVRGRGVGTEVNRHTVEVGRVLGLRRLWLSVEPHNRAAIRSYEKAGFHFLPGTILSVEAEMQMDL